MTDFWGCLKPPKNNPVDMMQLNFLKQLLRVQIQTPSIGILLETVHLSLVAQKSCIENRERIALNANCNLIKCSLAFQVRDYLLQRHKRDF